MMQKLSLADPKSILDKFDDEDRAKAKRVLRRTTMNRFKWLRLPMALLSQLLWKEEFDRMYQEKIQNLSARDTREYMNHEEDYEASYAMVLKATETVFVRKGLEIAVIANPDNGFDFFRLCISFPSWAHHKKVKGKEKSFSATINQPKDAHSPSTTKGRPPITAKGRPSTSKKRPRPAVSESSESLEEQFKLLRREDAKDSRHADSEQQSDSRRSRPSGQSRSQGSQRSSPSRQSRSQGSRRSNPARGSRSRDSRARTSDTARSHPSAKFLLDDGALVVACRAEHLFKVISEACEFQFCHIRTLFLRMPSHTYVMDCDFTDPVATLIVTMFVCNLDGPLPVPFYDRRADDIAADIDGYEADSDMLQEPLRESSWTLDTSGAAFRSGVEKSKFFARWLIGTFTTVGDAVLDCLAGCGSMATECKRLRRHCISIEKDVVVFRSLLFPQQRLPRESLAQPPIPHFYPPPTPQPPGIAQWPYGPSYPPPYTFMRSHSTWPPVMGGRPPLYRPLFAPPPMEPPPPPGQYPPPPPS
ncbi:hypothetical protein L7F22_000308 [Adiantum nelumboides]|nr:hypothetical protein [Adiantum nelumboides]